MLNGQGRLKRFWLKSFSKHAGPAVPTAGYSLADLAEFPVRCSTTRQVRQPAATMAISLQLQNFDTDGAGWEGGLQWSKVVLEIPEVKSSLHEIAFIFTFNKDYAI